MFEDLKGKEQGMQNMDKDSLGGRVILESGIYNMIIELAYGIEAASGARGVTVHLKEHEGDATFRFTEYVTSGTAKGGKTTYTDRDGKEQPLPGFSMINSLCVLASGKTIGEMATEEKVVNRWDNEAKAEKPQKTMVLTDLIGKPVKAGITKVIKNKQTKGADNKYHDTNEKITDNELDKIFRASDSRTYQEVLGETESAKFIEDWIKKREGQEIDRFKPVKGAPQSGAPAGASGDSKPTQSLFS